MSISLRSIRYFTASLAHGSIVRAAEELNIAPSSVSAALDQIEDRFQLKLVNRFRSRGITATASGKILERKFSRLLEEYDAVLAEGAELKETFRGELRVGYYAPIAPAFLPEILHAFSDQDTAPTLFLEECDNVRAQEGLLAGDFDVIFFVSDGAFPQLEFDVLVEAPAYCLMPENHPLAQQESVCLKDMAKFNFVVLNRPVALNYYRELFSEAQEAPPIVAYATSTEMVRSMVGAGHGISVLNMKPASDVSYAGDRLAVRAIVDPLLPLSLSLGYEKSNPRRVVKFFVNKCHAYFEAEGKLRHIVAAD